jgi:hypothetical protein
MDLMDKLLRQLLRGLQNIYAKKVNLKPTQNLVHNDMQIEDVMIMYLEVSHVQNRFTPNIGNRLSIRGLQFKSLSFVCCQNTFLVG